MTTSEIETGRWLPIPGFSAYEAGDRGLIRSINRVHTDGRRLKGVVLKARPSNQGYLLTNLTDDTGRKRTCSVHSLILLAFAGPCPPGQEALHGPGGKLDNRWPENLRWGTHSENERDKIEAGTAFIPEPSFPCINHGRCGGMTRNPGRRCRACVIVVGQKAAAMLNARVNLEDVADRLGYANSDWVYRLAVEHGDYTGTIREARKQRPSWSRRATATVRDKFRLGSR